ncbi:hypothetical protein COOONC_05619 [Cooperia oncophora]
MHGAAALDPMHMMLMGGSLPYQMPSDLSAVGMTSFDQAGPALAAQPLPSYNSAFFPAGPSGILAPEAKPSIDIKPQINNSEQDIQPVEQHYMGASNKNLDATLYANAGPSTMAALMPGYGSAAPWSLPTINSFSDQDTTSLYTYNGATLYANAGPSTMAALMPGYGSAAPWSLPTINSFSDQDTTSLYTYNGAV